MSVLELHGDFSWVVVGSNALAGAWALAATRMEQLRHRALWWFTAAAELTIMIQVCLGVWLVAQEDYEAPQIHTFYGFVALIAVTIMYGYKAQMRHQLHLLYGFGGLFLMGLAIRAMLLR